MRIYTTRLRYMKISDIIANIKLVGTFTQVQEHSIKFTMYRSYTNIYPLLPKCIQLNFGSVTNFNPGSTRWEVPQNTKKFCSQRDGIL